MFRVQGLGVLVCLVKREHGVVHPNYTCYYFLGPKVAMQLKTTKHGKSAREAMKGYSRHQKP